MNDSTTITPGSILRDPLAQTEYRVIHMQGGLIVLCQMRISKLVLTTMQLDDVFDALLKKTIQLTVDEEERIFDINKLTDDSKERYLKTLSVIREVEKIYGPTFLGLYGKKKKPELREILARYNYPSPTFWRHIAKYLQSGMKTSSLIDQKAFGLNKDKQYEYAHKTGRGANEFNQVGIPLTQETIERMQDGLKYYTSGRAVTMRDAYRFMNNKYFFREEVIEGVITREMLPESQRPTYRQFCYFIRKSLSAEELAIIKTSAQEFRNNRRLLQGSPQKEAFGPGDLVEVDACEADISLVSSLDRNITIGRPIVYLMVDVYTKIILAVAVDIENNSYVGVSNLFLNLADNKTQLAEKYGFKHDNPNIWPSNIIPKRVRADRGSEFLGEEFERVCAELGIQKDNVPAATGSYKGTVEQMFHQLHLTINPHVENYGLIEKRYDSNHHKEATLNFEEYTKMVIGFVFRHNQEYIESYAPTKDMIERKIQTNPIGLWEYGVEKYGNPRPISNIKQYKWTLLSEVKGKVCEKGILYDGLWYRIPDNDQQMRLQALQNGAKRTPIELRIDKRSVNAVYYKKNNTMYTAVLNEGFPANASFKDMSWFTFNEFKTSANKQAILGRRQNEEIGAFYALVNQNTVDAAKQNKKTYSDPSHMRENRKAERQALAQQGVVFPDANGTVQALPDEQQVLPKHDEQKPRKRPTLEELLDSDKW